MYSEAASLVAMAIPRRMRGLAFLVESLESLVRNDQADRCDREKVRHLQTHTTRRETKPLEKYGTSVRKVAYVIAVRTHSDVPFRVLRVMLECQSF